MTKHPAIRRSRPFVFMLALFVAPMWATFAVTNRAASESPHDVIRVGPKFEARFVSKPVVRLAAGGKPQVDPIEANGPIFVDWPKPDLALMFTGEQMGFLEPCGCAGLENQKGGFKRRMTLVKQLRQQDWPLIAMDTGGLVRRFGPQAQIKLARIYEGLVEMGYEAVGLGDKELRLDVLSEAANLDPNPLLSANIGLVDFDAGFTKRYLVVERAGMKVGMTSVLGKQETAAAAAMRDLVTMPPDEAIAEVLPKLLAENCDELVLLVYGEVAEAKDLSEKFPQFRWVVAGKGGDEPPKQPTTIPKSGARLIEIGHKGMYALVIGIYKQGEPRYRYQKVPMDHRFEDAPEMQQLLADYQDQLKTLVTAAGSFKPLTGGNPLPLPRGGGGFAGSEVCADCHTDACEVFMNSPHAHATETLVKLDPPRHFDPECLSCHVTGWNPQGFAPYVSGYESLEKTPHLVTQGCENCHGPAKDHYDAESGNIDATDVEIENFRAALRMKVVPNEGNMEGQVLGDVVKNCLECHDLDNSPDFDFQEYWDREENPVKHEGKN
ncbi:multiheme c-type cytochrome [Aeoliella sp.]|uniref:multiheme c-type cytochrome n=1 Tax=Aeoliella sp. TaxID=2795800 RepID=UPI003CCBEFC8